MEQRAAPSPAEARPLGTQQPAEPVRMRGPEGQVAPHRPAPAPAPGPAPAPRPTPAPAPGLESEREPVIAQEREPADRARKRKHRLRRFLARVPKVALAMAVLTELAAVSFIWVTPPRTAFMLETGGPIAYQYVSLNHISRSAVAHEDQQMGTRSASPCPINGL